MSEPVETVLEVTLWVCPQCAYWRGERPGVHQTPNPADPRGPMVTHPLVPVRFYSEFHPERGDAIVRPQ